MIEPTPEQRAQWEAWVAERPPAVAEVARKYPGFTCYRNAEGPGHYVITAYEEPEGDGPVTLKLAHGADSFAPGLGVFGVAPETIAPCGCGEWQWPSRDQAAATVAGVEDFKAAVDAAGLKIEPGLKLVPK